VAEPESTTRSPQPVRPRKINEKSIKLMRFLKFIIGTLKLEWQEGWSRGNSLSSN
jgi:hypothetical protein